MNRRLTDGAAARRYRIGRLGAVLAVLLLAATACGSTGNGTDEQALPDVELELLGGGTYQVRQTGEPRVLNLWATWCTPCRAELPALDDAARRIEGAQIVGINVGDTGSDAEELVDELGLSFPQALDYVAEIQQALRITGMPSTIFVDADGNVIDVHSGELTLDEIETMTADLLGATFGTG